MIAGLKPYPAMKDSGAPWLGEVPEHWDVRRLKSVCSKSALYGANVSASAYTPSGVRFLRTSDITEDGHLRNRGVFVPEAAVRDYVLNDGDLLISRSGTIGRSFVYDSRLHGRCAYAGYLVRFVPGAGALPEFLFLFTKTQAFAGFLRVTAISSTIENVNGEKYANSALPFPPLPEQTAIVRFLGYADRRVRRFVRAKQKLINLLEEQKQAIIHRAVTRGLPAEAAAKAGLDRNVRLKPSGVEWLGDVPEHWEVHRLKSLVRRIDQGVSPQAENYLADAGSWGVLKAGCVNRGVFREEQHKRLPAGFRIDPQLAIAEGDVLVSRASGSRNLVGSVGRVRSVRYRLILSDKTFRLLFNEGVDPEFMVLAMNSRYYREQVEQAISGAGGLASNLPLSSLRDFRFAIPKTLAEQQTILQGVRGIVSALLDSIVGAERECALLREYRARLIADVVTGKLDVREAAARLPDEAEEPEMLDDLEAEGIAEDIQASDVAETVEAVEA